MDNGGTLFFPTAVRAKKKPSRLKDSVFFRFLGRGASKFLIIIISRGMTQRIRCFKAMRPKQRKTGAGDKRFSKCFFEVV